MKRALIALTLLGAVGLALWMAAPLEEGPRFEPWLADRPEYARKQGYDDFRAHPPGSALRGWAEWWFERHPPAGDGPLLIDRRHATKQPEDVGLAMESYGYTQMHGFARAFEPARAEGVSVRENWEPWTPGVLSGASAVFINLVSGDNPPFSWSEARTLDAFVRAGGGLILITDHTNCYYHQEVLQPLTGLLGIAPQPVTAADKGPGKTLSPRSVAWARVFPKAPHAVNEGVRSLGWMTGGSVAPAPQSALQVVAGTSPTGWADRWDAFRKDDSAGFTGNLKQDDDEPSAEVPVIIAGRHGEGRVVVLADQNAWGATLIGYEDNARLFSNAVGYAVGMRVPTTVRGPGSVTTLSGPRSLCSSAAEFGYRTFQVQAQRLSWARQVPEFCTIDQPVSAKRLVVMPETERPGLATELAEAERVLALIEPGQPGTEALGQWLGVQFEARAGEPGRHVIGLDTLPPVEHRSFDERPETEPIIAHPVGAPTLGTARVRDDQGRPLVVELEHQGVDVMLVLDATLLVNERMGNERVKPWKGEPAQEATHRLALSLWAWLFPAP